MAEHITWSTALRLLANLLTATSAVAWLKFADTREGILSAPNIHHRVYLRLLIALSCTAFIAGILSLAVTAHASPRLGRPVAIVHGQAPGVQGESRGTAAAGDAPGTERPGLGARH